MILRLSINNQNHQMSSVFTEQYTYTSTRVATLTLILLKASWHLIHQPKNLSWSLSWICNSPTEGSNEVTIERPGNLQALSRLRLPQEEPYPVQSAWSQSELCPRMFRWMTLRKAHYQLPRSNTNQTQFVTFKDSTFSFYNPLFSISTKTWYRRHWRRHEQRHSERPISLQLQRFRL